MRPWHGKCGRATLAEKEVNSLKEKLSTTDRGVSNNNNNISNSVNNNDGNDMDVTAPPPPPPSLSAPTLPTSLPLAASTSPTPPTSSSPLTIIEQNGIAPPSPSTTPVSDSGSIHRPEVALSPSDKPLAGSRSPMTVMSTRSRTPEIDRKVQQELAGLTHTINNNCLSSSNNNHNSNNNRSPTQSPPATAEKMECESASAVPAKELTSSSSSSSSSARTSVSECHKGSSEKLNNSSSETNCSSGEVAESPNKDSVVESRTRSLTEELSAKDREKVSEVRTLREKEEACLTIGNMLILLNNIRTTGIVVVMLILFACR
uniref:Uncharacterized protein n=1 Tax=Anopheles stephensi TaxID=30069 RepID=A0A182YHT4_ANOST